MLAGRPRGEGRRGKTSGSGEGGQHKQEAKINISYVRPNSPRPKSASRPSILMTSPSPGWENEKTTRETD